jgi:hypothetical protein
LKYREDNVNGIKDAQQRIKENMKKIKEKLIQRINQVERELWSIILLTVTSPNFLMDNNKSFDSSKESETRFSSDVDVCRSPFY